MATGNKNQICRAYFEENWYKIKERWVSYFKNQDPNLGLKTIFVFCLVFFHEHSRFIQQQGKGEAVS